MHKVINSDRVLINEYTKDRIYLTSQLSKIFGFRIFNALFIKIENHIICMLNHKHDLEISEILQSTDEKSFGKRRGSDSGNVYTDFDLKMNCCHHPLFETIFCHIISDIDSKIKVLNDQILSQR